MCLAIPALIKSISDKEAEVEIGGISRRANVWLTPEAKVGDYVLLHTGYAISIVDPEEAKETLKLLEEIAELAEEE
jgi:hydrogenase expression/formation protein HypC